MAARTFSHRYPAPRDAAFPYTASLAHRISAIYGVAKPVWPKLPSVSMPTEKEALARKLGALVQRLRSERGLSQDKFAERCSIDRTHMGKIERGEVNVTVATMVQLVRGLDLTLTGFFSELEKELNGTNQVG